MSESPRLGSSGEWLSAYLFFAGDIYREESDRILLEVIAPWIEQWSQMRPGLPWFFVRYSEGGPHLRFRVFGSPEWLEETVRPTIQAVDVPAIERVVFAEYEPEFERYGGPEGMKLSEELFHRSSETALALLRKTELGDRSARFGKGLLAMLVLLHAFERRRQTAAEAAEIYGTNYLRAQVPDPNLQQHWMATFIAGFDRQANQLSQYVEAAWEALACEESLTPELDRYRESLQEAVDGFRTLLAEERLELYGKSVEDWPEVIHRIAASHLHMMNNRLGVDIREECYLSVLIFKILLQDSAADRAIEPVEVSS